MAKNLSARTVEYYHCRLSAFRRYLTEHGFEDPDISEITPELLRDFLADQCARFSATTASHSYCALSAFFTWLVRELELAENPVQRVEKPRRRKTLIQTLSIPQLEALLRKCGRDFYGVRDRAVILTLIDTGLRVSELCGLTLDAIDFEQQTMRVLGKGGRERMVPFGMQVRAALLTYLSRRGELPTDAVFVNHYGEPLNRRGVNRILEKLGRAAGISGVRLSPHTLRHTFAKQWLVNGGDVFSLQKALGHTTLQMVRHYVELADTEVCDVHRRVSPADQLGAASGNKRRRLR